MLYGGAHLESAPLGSFDGTGLGSGSVPAPQSRHELQFGYRGSGGRALNSEDYGAFGNTDRFDDKPSFNGASKLKGAPRKMIPGPQQKGPANVKRGYRQVLQSTSLSHCCGCVNHVFESNTAHPEQEIDLHPYPGLGPAGTLGAGRVVIAGCACHDELTLMVSPLHRWMHVASRPASCMIPRKWNPSILWATSLRSVHFEFLHAMHRGVQIPS